MTDQDQNQPPQEAPETKEIELPGGVRVSMAAADAEKYIAQQAQRTAEFNTLKQEREAIAAEAAQRKAEAEAAQREAAAAEAAKSGDIEKAKQIWQQEIEIERKHLRTQLSTLSLQNELAKRQDIVGTALDDITASLRESVVYVDGKLTPVGQDGKPLTNADGTSVSANDYVTEWLSKRPHYQRDKTPSGSGADGKGTPPKMIGSVTRAQYEAAASKGGPEFTSMSKALSNNQLILKD